MDYKYDNFSDDFLEQVECRQIELSNGRGRIHGFIGGNIFYIVWIDAHHNLYPIAEYGGRKIHKEPIIYCRALENEIKTLKYDIEKEEQIEYLLNQI